MRSFAKHILAIFFLALACGLFYQLLLAPHLSPSGEPQRIPTHAEVVPAGFSALGVTRILDPRDAGPLLEPRLPLVKVADAIVAVACPNRQPSCRVQALYRWTKENIEYMEVLPTRAHVISPEETILYRQGNDLTLSILLGALLRSEGFPARVGITPYVTFLETRVGNETIRLDPGCAGCPYGRTRYDGPEDAVTWIS